MYISRSRTSWYSAGETKDPEKNIRKAVKSVAIRIVVFFVFSKFIIAYIIPYKDSSVANTPFFVTVLQLVNISYIDTYNAACDTYS